MSQWRDCREDAPDWKDVGQNVVLRYTDGREISGRLEADEFFTGEDEVPVPRVVLDDGTEVSFFDAQQWRPVSASGDQT